jgi:hypothetical protein
MTRMKRIAKRKKKMVTRMRRSIWRLSIRATAKERRRKGQEREEGERQD